MVKQLCESGFCGVWVMSEGCQRCTKQASEQREAFRLGGGSRDESDRFGEWDALGGFHEFGKGNVEHYVEHS